MGYRDPTSGEWINSPKPKASTSVSTYEPGTYEPGTDRGAAQIRRAAETKPKNAAREESPFSYIDYKTGKKVKITMGMISGGSESGTDRGDARVASGQANSDAVSMAQFNKKYNEDPVYRKQVQDARGSSNIFDRVGKSFQNMAETVVDGAKEIAPTVAMFAAAMYGGHLLNAAQAGGAGAAGSTIMGGTAAPGGVYSAGAGAIVPNSAAAATAFNAAAGSNALSGLTGSEGLSALSGSGSMSPGAMAPITGADALTGAAGPAANALAGGAPDWLDNALIAGSSLASGYLSHDATEKGIKEIGRQYDQTRADMEPWRQAGVNALGSYEDRLGQPVDKFQFNLEDDPIYQFQRDEALKATERGMAARGYNESGNVLRELQRTAIGEAGRYQGDAYNRQLGTSQTNYGREFDRTNQYGNLSGIGQSTTNALANVGQNSANQLSNLYMQQGQGYNNALQGGISNYLVNERSKNNQYNPWNPYGQYRGVA